MKRELLYLGILAALAGLSAWFLATVKTSIRDSTFVDENVPRLYADNFQLVHTNQQGTRNYTLTAPRLVQLPGQEGTQVQQPAMDIFEQGDLPVWLLRAETGWVSADNEIIQLETVTFTRPATSGKYPMILTTSKLTLYPKRDFAETAEPVRMDSPNSQITATGLKAYLDEDRLELLSEVRGHHVPAKP